MTRDKSRCRGKDLPLQLILWAEGQQTGRMGVSGNTVDSSPFCIFYTKMSRAHGLTIFLVISFWKSRHISSFPQILHTHALIHTRILSLNTNLLLSVGHKEGDNIVQTILTGSRWKCKMSSDFRFEAWPQPSQGGDLCSLTPIAKQGKNPLPSTPGNAQWD